MKPRHLHTLGAPQLYRGKLAKGRPWHFSPRTTELHLSGYLEVQISRFSFHISGPESRKQSKPLILGPLGTLWVSVSPLNRPKTAGNNYYFFLLQRRKQPWNMSQISHRQQISHMQSYERNSGVLTTFSLLWPWQSAGIANAAYRKQQHRAVALQKCRTLRF